MKRGVLFIWLLLQSFLIKAQESVVINGYVEDVHTGERLVSAVVMVKGTSNAVFTNEFGYFVIRIKKEKDTVFLKASYPGYLPEEKIVILNQNHTVIFRLRSDNRLDTVLVYARIPETKTTDIGKFDIPVRQINLMPVLGSEADPMKAVQMLPGIEGTDLGRSYFNVRGGYSDENMILLDGVPLYYVGHLGGFVSVFNMDAIKSVQFYKGGFPARFYGRLSSVMDIRMKDGDMFNYHGNFSLGFLSAKLLYQGPVIKNKASFLFSFRTFPWSGLMKFLTLLGNQGQSLGYNFYDFNAKVNYKVNDKNHLFLSFYTGDDKLGLNFSRLFNDNQYLKMRRTWGNRLAALRWNYIFSHDFFVNTTFAYTLYHFDDIFRAKNKEENNFFEYNFNTKISDLTLQSIFDYNALRFLRIVFGYTSAIHNFNPGISYVKIQQSDTLENEHTSSFGTYQAFENRMFIENRINLKDIVKLNLGFNLVDYSIQGKNFIYLEPRFVSTIIFSDDFSFKAGLSKMSQTVHLLTSNSIGLTPDIWIPSGKEFSPSTALQYSLGFFSSTNDNRLEFSMIAYYKKSSGLIAYKEGAVFNGNAENWQDKIAHGGIGLSYGIELFIRKKYGKNTGWISYTYAKSLRKFEQINSGKYYPFKYDRRHRINIVFIRNITRNLSFSFAWTFGSGYPITLPVGLYAVPDDASLVSQDINAINPYGFTYGRVAYIYSDRNAYRMKPYHRLDLGLNFNKKVKHGVSTWTISIYNAYNRENPYFYYLKQENGKVKIYQQSLFPIIPSVSYSLTF